MKLLPLDQLAEGVEKWSRLFSMLAALEEVDVTFLHQWVDTTEALAQMKGPDPDGDTCREVGREILKEVAILKAMRDRHYKILSKLEESDADRGE